MIKNYSLKKPALDFAFCSFLWAQVLMIGATFCKFKISTKLIFEKVI